MATDAPNSQVISPPQNGSSPRQSVHAGWSALTAAAGSQPPAREPSRSAYAPTRMRLMRTDVDRTHRRDHAIRV